MRISDWSSDVCSSDLRSACRPALGGQPARLRRARRRRRDHRGEACMCRALLLAVALVSPPAFATPALAPIWTDHAVLQRDRPVVIEGSADIGRAAGRERLVPDVLLRGVPGPLTQNPNTRIT